LFGGIGVAEGRGGSGPRLGGDEVECVHHAAEAGVEAGLKNFSCGAAPGGAEGLAAAIGENGDEAEGFGRGLKGGVEEGGEGGGVEGGHVDGGDEVPIGCGGMECCEEAAEGAFAGPAVGEDVEAEGFVAAGGGDDADEMGGGGERAAGEFQQGAAGWSGEESLVCAHAAAGAAGEDEARGRRGRADHERIIASGEGGKLRLPRGV
jgi:hypothetical protein